MTSSIDLATLSTPRQGCLLARPHVLGRPRFLIRTVPVLFSTNRVSYTPPSKHANGWRGGTMLSRNTSALVSVCLLGLLMSVPVSGEEPEELSSPSCRTQGPCWP